MEIIPAIDIIDGKCVRLSQGDFSRRKIYDASPLEIARRFEDSGIGRLHLVDLEGAKYGSIHNLKVLEAISANTGLKIDFGGGVNSGAELRRVFDAGAAMISVGSIAVKEPHTFFEWLSHYGGEKFLLGADVRDGKLAIDGWRTDTEIDLVPFLAEYTTRGIDKAFVTDIRKDGQLGGPALCLYREIRQNITDLKLIASGGVGSIEDVEKLESVGCAGVIIGKALYEGRIGLNELTRYVG